MYASLLRLPFDVLEDVIETLNRRDLLSLALTCSAWKDIIIPRHLEYREISLSVDHHLIWKHLAERPSLAANVRKLVISDSEFYHSSLSFPLICCFRWQIPTTLIPPWSDIPYPHAQLQDYPLLALRNMRLLNTLEFENISRWSQGSPDTLSQFLAHIPSVENLVLRSSRSRGSEVEGIPEDVQVSTSSVRVQGYLVICNDRSQTAWELPNLKSAVLTGMPWDRKYVRPFRNALMSCSDLQVSFRSKTIVRRTYLSVE
jgi:F-box domain